MDIEKLVPDMGPAGGLRHGARFEDGIEACIAVSVKNALEALQMQLGMLTLAVGRVEEHGSRRLFAAARPAITDIGP